MEGISVEQAMEQILQYTPVINETEEVELNKAGGRILAQDMVAGFNNPPFDRSPVDGYACSRRINNPCDQSPYLPLQDLGNIQAQHT